MNIDQIVDALGNKIALGHKYGYSTAKSGLAHTVIGAASKLHASGCVTINVEEVKHFLYGELIDHDWHKNADTVVIRGHMIFPVNR